MTEQIEIGLSDMISESIVKIRDGQTTPKKSGIGRMLVQLQREDQDKYSILMEEYKPVSFAYFSNNPSTSNKTAILRKDRLIQKEYEATLGSINDDLSDDGPVDDDFSSLMLNDDDDEDRPRSKRPAVQIKPKTVDKARIARVIALVVPKTVKPKGDRDRSSMIFMGQEYGKGPLVRAVLMEHVRKNPNITHDDMKNAFPDSLLRSYGIFKKFDEAQEISKVRKRYFLKDDHLIQLKDCKVAVCNQFTSDNIHPFLSVMKKIGYFLD